MFLSASTCHYTLKHEDEHASHQFAPALLLLQPCQQLLLQRLSALLLQQPALPAQLRRQQLQQICCA
jgi:hypothetical protein